MSREADSEQELRRFTRRAVLLGLVQLGAFGVLGGRLYRIQVEDQRRYRPIADGNRISTQIIAPERGRILDRFGEVLARNEEGFRVVLVPSRAARVSETLTLLSRIVPLSPADIEELAQRARRGSPSSPLVIASSLSFHQVAEINLLAPHLPGLKTEQESRRRYSHGDAVGHVVGHVGAVERLALDDEPVLRVPGIKVGKVGVERGMDRRLRGEAGSERLEVDARGRIMGHLGASEPKRGEDVVLSIDTSLQRKVLALLGQQRRAAAVVIELERGEVLALVSVPTYDPGDVVNGVSRRTWWRLITAAHRPMVNRAANGLYPPGSTFKMVTALAAIEAGVLDQKERLSCTGTYELADKSFRCWARSGHGRSDLHRALRESCDCYFYEAAHRAGIEKVAAMARRLGLGEVYRSGLEPVAQGIVPDPDWKRGRLRQGWLGGETLLAGIGQGYVLATPLQLAVMTARIATGRKVTPTFVRTQGAHDPPFAPLGIDERALDAVRRGMLAAVNEDAGTGASARIDEDDFKVAGKTGTSQVTRRSSDRSSNDVRWELRDHALFVCYVPADKPRYAISVVIEHGGSGGATAAPVARRIAELLKEDDPLSRTVQFSPGREDPHAAPRTNGGGRG